MSKPETDDVHSPAVTTDVPVPFLKQVKIRNYKSIVNCDVELGALTVLVGRNGAGKSNFLDALRFVADALRKSLTQAIESRGGMREICHRGTASANSFEIELEFVTRSVFHINYGFGVKPKGDSDFEVEWERFEERFGDGIPAKFERTFSKIYPDSEHYKGHKEYAFIENDLVLKLVHNLIPVHNNASVLAELNCYDLDPRSMRDPRTHGAGEILHNDGSNIASVFGRIERERPEVKNRVIEYLSAIVPGVTDIKRMSLGPYETLEFTQQHSGSDSPSVFYPLNMSDGTLRAFGALVAVAQLAEGNVPVSLVGIEEPEAALHPAAAGALMDALHEAAVHTQIVVTTHSPDLLDRLDFDTDRILVVESRNGQTQIGPIDNASRQAIKKHLFSPGELLRMDQLEIDWTDLERQRQSKSTATAGRAE